MKGKQLKMKISKKFDLMKLKDILKNKNILLVIGLAGILLIFLSEIVPKEKTDKDNVTNSQNYSYEYASQLETKLENILQTVEGVGSVNVMITIESGEQNVYAQSEKTDNDVKTSDDLQTSQTQTFQNEYIIVEDEQGSKVALTETTLEPEIKGVGIVCTGADDFTVEKNITEMVSVILGVPSNRVYVIKMNE